MSIWWHKRGTPNGSVWSVSAPFMLAVVLIGLLITLVFAVVGWTFR